MRTYRISQARGGAVGTNHAGIREILADIEATTLTNGFGEIDSLMSQTFDRKALSSKGLKNKKLVGMKFWALPERLHGRF